MSFNHRLEDNNIDKLTHTGLVDAIHSMTQRAEAVITILEGEFVIDKGGRLEDEVMFQALHSVRMDILDMRVTVNKYHEYQRKLEGLK